MVSFKIARISAGKKAAETAEYMGVSVTALSAWENGHYLPSSDKLRKLADFYGCTIDELLEPTRGELEREQRT